MEAVSYLRERIASNQILGYSLAGGMSGITVDLVYYPLETIKTRIMASNVSENLLKSAQSISKFKGFSCQMLVSFPYSYMFFYVYGKIRQNTNRSALVNIFAGGMAETLSNVVRNPLELIKQRLMVGRERRITESFRNIYASRGLVGFYTGYAPTLLRDVLFSATQMPLFQAIKRPIASVLSREKEDAVICSLSGSLSGMIAAFVTCPLDVIKTRHMTLETLSKEISFMGITQEIYRESGIRGFFRGVFYRCLILSLGGGALYFYAFGAFKQMLRVGDI